MSQCVDASMCKSVWNVENVDTSSKVKAQSECINVRCVDLRNGGFVVKGLSFYVLFKILINSTFVNPICSMMESKVPRGITSL
jgi:hypothetical protein